jgi:hypothetical protein
MATDWAFLPVGKAAGPLMFACGTDAAMAFMTFSVRSRVRCRALCPLRSSKMLVKLSEI